MTAMADLGLITDARGLLIELGRRFGADPVTPETPGAASDPARAVEARHA
jgi:hypothetical protein